MPCILWYLSCFPLCREKYTNVLMVVGRFVTLAALFDCWNVHMPCIPLGISAVVDTDN